MKTTWMFLAGALCALAATSACSSNTSKGLAVSARASSTTSGVGPAGLTLPDGITLSRIRMAVQRISVEGDDPENACSTAVPAPVAKAPMAAMASSLDGGPGPGRDGKGEDDGACEGSFGPFDVDLAGSALHGAVTFAFDAPIPAGTYEELEIRVNTVPKSRAGGNQVLEDLAKIPASIVVDGFIEVATSTFTFSTPLEVTQKREGKIVIGPGSNVTLDFDPTHWFDGPSGRLDPRDPSAQGAILANIRASIRILEDDDRDGRDDSEEHGGGH